MINEIEILNCTHLEADKIGFCTNSIFSFSLANDLKKEMESFAIGDISSKEIFEMFYVVENYVAFIYGKTLSAFSSTDVMGMLTSF